MVERRKTKHKHNIIIKFYLMSIRNEKLNKKTDCPIHKFSQYSLKFTFSSKYVNHVGSYNKLNKPINPQKMGQFSEFR